MAAGRGSDPDTARLAAPAPADAPAPQAASGSNHHSALHTVTVGTGPAVVFVHGMADDSSVWPATVEQLSAEFACTTADLPGHGNSPAPTEEAYYQREALLQGIDEMLTRTGPATFVGHSLGGYLGLAHCLTRPGAITGLVLVATGPGFRDTAAMQDWNERVKRSAAKLDIAPVAATASLHTDSMVIDRLSEVTVPVGLLVGSRDRAFVGANDYMERKLPDVRRRTVEGAGHRLMRSHPAEVAAMVREVLAASRSR